MCAGIVEGGVKGERLVRVWELRRGRLERRFEV